MVAAKKNQANMMLNLLLEMRPKQWTKNILVFASALFSGNIFLTSTFINAFLAFIAFSFISSTVYIINDIVDIEKDRQHPDKCKRPLASGALSVPAAVTSAIFLCFISLTIAFLINTEVLFIVMLYFIINLFYTLRLKHVVLIDVMIIASGFVLRAVCGAFATGGVITSWFILCILGLSLFLALGKRRHELVLFNDIPEKQRKVLQHYSVELLDQLMTVITGLLLMFFSMYAASQESGMMYTIPLAIYGVFRYYYLIHKKNGGGKPEEILLNDKHILATVIMFGLVVVLIKTQL
ncbi:hypothetical protein SY83_13155 [Paenibacillus swuensis]|uniref:Phosphoribose diphosphate:decaprenyl-phosphate phosphoribosyltransferase n=2 Tax=Paenibacillus swuensis TaxID=1178515 RepID=A0A172TPC8_9BACL|nr:hypothetical protein SY83_13155 [Paenibacillus swuensis]